MTKEVAVPTSDGEVVAATSFDIETLSKIGSYSEAMTALSAMGVQVENVADYGDGFNEVDKASLVNIQMVLLGWKVADSAYPGPNGETGDYVFVRAVTATGDKVIFFDGGTGIARQLIRITKMRIEKGVSRPDAGLICPNGLRVSKFFYDEKTGEISKEPKNGFAPASTYYLAE